MTTTSLASGLNRRITQDEISAYERDGAAVLRGVLDMAWVEHMREAIQRILDNPGEASLEYTPKGKSGRYYGDLFVWRRDEDFAAFMSRSPMPEISAQLMGVDKVWFFYDQLLVKEPNTAEPTPWHQDGPYWPVRGEQVMSIWVPFDHATRETGVVTYVKGSHRWGKTFAPTSFSKDSGYSDQYAKMGLEPCPDIEAHRDEYDLLCETLAPGDVLVHHPLTLHYASGNSSPTGRRRGLALRYVGPDAVWDSRPGTFIHNPKVQALLPKFRLKDGDPLGLQADVFPQVWPSAD